MSLLTITDEAAAKIRALLAKDDRNGDVLKLGTSTKGCNGLSYTLDYVKEPAPGDELVEDKGVRIYVEAKSLIYLMGTVMDWEEGTFQTGFTFSNPNEKGRCGCGESFNV